MFDDNMLVSLVTPRLEVHERGSCIDLYCIDLVLSCYLYYGSDFPPVVPDWVIEGLGMSSLVFATGHIIKDPVPLIKKSRASCPGGRFPPRLIHQVIIITGLNKLYD